MKYIIILVVTCLSLNFVVAQKKLPGFGKIDKSDLQMTDCDFDKGAVAVKLIDYANMYYDRGTLGVTLFKTMYEYRVRIKILKEKGLSYANVDVPFYNDNDDEKISHIDACTLNLDENGKVKVTDVSKSSIYVKKINKRYSRLIIAFPEAKAGSVVEYRYTLERESFYTIKSWYFQDDIPTRYSEYEVNIPRVFVFKPQPTIFDSIEVKEKNINDVISVENNAYTVEVLKQNYVMRNLPGIKDEPFMGAPRDYKQHLDFQLSKFDEGEGHVVNYRTKWGDVVHDLNKEEDFGLQLSGELKGFDDIIQKALVITDHNERINYVYNSIRRVMHCNSKEGVFTYSGINNAWARKQGNAGDINLMLVAVLKKAELPAWPILLSSRDNGLVNVSYQSTNQFNIVMAYIPLDKGFLILDATEKNTDYRLTPERIVNTKGFIIDNQDGQWIDAIDNIHKYKINIALHAVIDNNAMMKGDCSINSIDYCRKERIDKYNDNSDAFNQEYFVKPYPGVSVSDISVKNETVDSLPFYQQVKFTSPVNNSGGYLNFNTNFFNDFDKNLFVQDDRNSVIDFGVQHEYLINAVFTIPHGYAYEPLPEDISMSTAGRTIQFTRMMNAAGNTLNMRITIDFRKTFYETTEYPDFHAFYNKLLSSLNEQVIIKKKV